MLVIVRRGRRSIAVWLPVAEPLHSGEGGGWKDGLVFLLLPFRRSRNRVRTLPFGLVDSLQLL